MRGASLPSSRRSRARTQRRGTPSPRDVPARVSRSGRACVSSRRPWASITRAWVRQGGRTSGALAETMRRPLVGVAPSGAHGFLPGGTDSGEATAAAGARDADARIPLALLSPSTDLLRAARAVVTSSPIEPPVLRHYPSSIRAELWVAGAPVVGSGANRARTVERSSRFDGRHAPHEVRQKVAVLLHPAPEHATRAAQAVACAAGPRNSAGRIELHHARGDHAGTVRKAAVTEERPRQDVYLAVRHREHASTRWDQQRPVLQNR